MVRASPAATSVSSSRSSGASSAGSVSRNWNSISARPGTMLGAPGSSVIRPVVQTVRGPATSGNRSLIAAAKRTSATPASLRIAMRVVPAWFCTPSNTMRKRWLPTIAVTMPMRSPQSPPVRRPARYAPPDSRDSARHRPQRAAARQTRPVPAPRATASPSRLRARVDLGVGHQTAERTAAEERAEMAFLVGPRCDVDAAAERARRPPGRRSRPARHPASRHAAASRHGCRAAACGPRAARASDDVADAVDFRISPASVMLLGQPVARCDIIGRVGRPMHAGLVLSDPGAAREGRRAAGRRRWMLSWRRVSWCDHDPLRAGSSRPASGTKPDTLSDSAHSHLA